MFHRRQADGPLWLSSAVFGLFLTFFRIFWGLLLVFYAGIWYNRAGNEGGDDMSFFGKMLASIGADWYIFVCAAVCVVCLVVIRLSNKKIDRSFELWKSENYYSNFIYKARTLSSSVFVTLITIFPLLGMLGTVKSLLVLNFGDENAILNAKSSFFDALTSTAWGIIFAILFKVINAVISKHTEDNIEKISGLISGKAVNIDAQRAGDKREGYEK